MYLSINNFDYNFFIDFYNHLSKLKFNKIQMFKYLSNNQDKFLVWSYEHSYLYNTYSWNDYIYLYNDLSKLKSNKNGLLHYIRCGYNENRNIFKKICIDSKKINWGLFDWEFYIHFYNDLKNYNKQQAQKHYELYGINENRLFSYEHSYYYHNYDWQYFKEINKEFNTFSIKKVFEFYIKNKLCKEYTIYPKKNILDVNIFHWKFYLTFYDDLKKNKINNYEKAVNHLLNFGFNEGRLYSNEHNNLYYNYDWNKYNLDYKLNKTNDEAFVYYVKHGVNDNHIIKPILNENTFYFKFFNNFNNLNLQNLEESIHFFNKNQFSKNFLYSYQHYLIFMLFDWQKIYEKTKLQKNHNINEFIVYYLNNYKNIDISLILIDEFKFLLFLKNNDIFLFFNQLDLLKNIIYHNISFNNENLLYKINQYEKDLKNNLFLNINLLDLPPCFEIISSKKHEEDIKFSFVISSYNNVKNIKNNLLSVIYQNYKNWEIYYTNDKSTDNTHDIFQEIVKKYNIKHKVFYQKNKKNMGQIYNKYKSYQNIDDNNIVIILDGDDWLSSSNVLNTLYKIYKNNDYKIVYSTYKIFFNNKVNEDNLMNFHSYPDDVKKNISYRTYPYWHFYHLKSGYALYFKNIPKNYLKYNNEWLDRCTDLAEMYSAVELAGGNIYFINEPLYIYNKTNSMNYSNSYYYDYKSTKRKNIEKYIKNLPPLNKLILNS